MQYCDLRQLSSSTATSLYLSCSTSTSLWLSCSTTTFVWLSCRIGICYFSVLQLRSSYLALQKLLVLRHCNLLIAILQYCNLISCSKVSTATYLQLSYSTGTFYLAVLPLSCSCLSVLQLTILQYQNVPITIFQ